MNEPLTDEGGYIVPKHLEKPLMDFVEAKTNALIGAIIFPIFISEFEKKVNENLKKDEQDLINGTSDIKPKGFL